MLVEQLSVGRCISLPSIATGGAKGGVYSCGAYARIRRQFNLPIGKFEGVEAVIARMAARTYLMEAARSVTLAAIDSGEKPAVPAGILKYHLTESGRMVANDAMDVQGGKGIMLGPKNYLGRGYQMVPVSITVEGANILTRSLIIFGQGAVRCHPFVLKEMNAAQDTDRERGLRDFDVALFGHIRFTISNAVRSFIAAVTLSRIVHSPLPGPTTRYFEHINRFSASFALAADVAMLSLGGYLKKKENLSARLGDVLSNIYLASMALKHFENQGRPEADLAARRVRLPLASLSGAGAAALLPAEFSGALARGDPARPHLPARAHLLRAERPPEPADRGARDEPRRGARAALPFRLSHARAQEPPRPRAAGDGARNRGGAAGEEDPHRRGEDRAREGARPSEPDPRGARGRDHHRGRGGAASRIRPQGHGYRQRG
jgi:alkylation response protein AidB-like acyl-CoA dehydrogenase